MNILVFIKQVADTEARIIIGGDNKTLEIENKYAVNFFDEFAIEEAIKIKEKIKGSTITICTYGPQRATEALRTAIAMGADRAFLIDSANYESDDPLVVAEILVAFAKKEGFDCILCGRQAMDDENANIGAMTAEFLDIPHANRITKLDVLEGGKVRVESEIEGGKRVLDITLPVLLTTQKGLNEPRVPLMTGVMRAMKTEIIKIDPASLDVPREALEKTASKTVIFSYEAPPQRPPVKIVDGETPEEKAKALIKALRDDAKVI